MTLAPMMTQTMRPNASDTEIRGTINGADGTAVSNSIRIGSSGTAVTREDTVVREKFAILADWWHADTDALSSDRAAYQHPAYRRIVTELGSAAIAPMLEDLRDRGGHWFDALTELTGDRTVESRAGGSMRRARDAWLSWGRQNGQI